MDIFEKQKFCQETLIQIELANPKENRSTTPKGPYPKKTRKKETNKDINKNKKVTNKQLKLAANTPVISSHSVSYST